MAGPIASLVIKLGLDATGVQQGVDKAQAALGGLTRGKVMRAVGAGMATGLASAARASADMEDRAARFRAETGASAEEAQRFAEYVNAASGTTVLGLDAIGDTATKVRTDMGLVGDEMARQTDLFLRYERATGQGADAVLAYDDILDAWNLTAADAQQVMDSLVASHQAYGGAVTADQDALAKLAPVLRGADMGWEDAVALINAAKASGLDAAEMVPALTRALSKVGSPDELQGLVDDIAAIPDDGERAARAMDLFGARGGLKLAQALANGGLEGYRQQLDQVTGATEEAADALDDTWSVKVRKALDAATSLIRGFGMELGPALTGALAGADLLGALGVDRATMAKAGGAIKAGLTRLLAKVGLEQAGTAVASRFATAFGAALPLVGVAAAGVAIGAWIGQAIAGPEVQKATDEATAKIGSALEGMVTDEQLDAARAKLVQAQRDIGGAMFGLGSVIDFGTRDALQQQIDAIDAKKAALHAAAEGAGDAVADGLDAGAVAARRAAHGVSKAMGALDLTDLAVDAKGVRRSTAEIRAAMIGGLGSAAQAAESGMTAISAAMAKPPRLVSMKQRMAQFGKAARAAWRNMRAAVKADDPVNAAYWEQQYLNVRNEQGKLRGSTTKTMGEIRADMQAAGVAIPKALAKGASGARKHAARLAKDVDTRMRKLKDDTARKADQAAESVPDALRDSKGETTVAAKGLATATTTPLAHLDTYRWGRHAGDMYAAGIRASTPVIGAAAIAAAGAAAGPLRFSAPPKVGPLKDIRSWGPHMLDQWSQGTEKGLRRVERTAIAWASAATPTMGASRWQPATAPAVTERLRRPLRGIRHGGGGDTHIHVGTLVANDAGIDDLRRRMDRRVRMRRRDRRVVASPNGQER